MTRRNSSLTEPESWTNRSACSSGLTSQNDPYDQPNASRTVARAAVITSRTVRLRPRASSNWLTARVSAAVSASRLAVSTFSVTTSQVIIGPMYLPFWSSIALTISSKSSGPTLIVAVRGRLRGSARIRR